MDFFSCMLENLNDVKFNKEFVVLVKKTVRIIGMKLVTEET